MRKLGVHLRDCPRCKGSFNAGRRPRFWLTTMIDGELSEGKPEKDLFCSSECAHAEGADRKKNAADNEGYMVFVDADYEDVVR